MTNPVTSKKKKTPSRHTEYVYSEIFKMGLAIIMLRFLVEHNDHFQQLHHIHKKSNMELGKTLPMLDGSQKEHLSYDRDSTVLIEKRFKQNAQRRRRVKKRNN